ncbi:hypothetical protein LINGRAHAP2_LOCUS12766 [Linum grandiflorum]
MVGGRRRIVMISLLLCFALSSAKASTVVAHLLKLEEEIDHNKKNEQEDLEQMKILARGSKSRRARHAKDRPVNPPPPPPPPTM